jgi:hypothetical protein
MLNLSPGFFIRGEPDAFLVGLGAFFFCSCSRPDDQEQDVDKLGGWLECPALPETTQKHCDVTRATRELDSDPNLAA